MLIGLTGKQNSGKDTVAAYLMKNYQFERRSFADPLKLSLSKFLGVPVWEIEKMKNDRLAEIHIGYEDYDGADNKIFVKSDIEYTPMTLRQALQRYGTEAHRDVFGENFWIDACLPVGGYYVGRKIVVTDCRFRNEAERVTMLGGSIVRILRDSVDDGDTHSSEEPLPIRMLNYTIYNDGPIEQLYSAIDELLVKIGIAQ